MMWGVCTTTTTIPTDLFVISKNNNNNSLRFIDVLIHVEVVINVLANCRIESTVGHNTFSHKTPILFDYYFQLLKTTTFFHPLRQLINFGNIQNGTNWLLPVFISYKEVPRHLGTLGTLLKVTHLFRHL